MLISLSPRFTFLFLPLSSLLQNQVLGHESAGIVTAIGSSVKTHKVGDRVALEPGEFRISNL